MKKLINIIMAIMLVLTIITGCVNNEEGIIKDNAVYYESLADAVFEKKGADENDIISQVEIDGIISVSYFSGVENGYVVTSITFVVKNEWGYLPYKYVNAPNAISDSRASGIMIVKTLFDKELLIFSSESNSKDDISITDNYGNEFKSDINLYKYNYDCLYMLVLDKIPEDYKIIINGISYDLPQKSYSSEIVGIVIFGLITLLIIGVLKRIKEVKREKEERRKDIF